MSYFARSDECSEGVRPITFSVIHDEHVKEYVVYHTL